MRTLVLSLVAVAIAGCATTPSGTMPVYDHKYNTYSFVSQSPKPDFVGTSGRSSKATPNWAPANTTPVYDHKANSYSYVPK